MMNTQKEHICLTFGVFDGVTLGHQAVLQNLVSIARTRQLKPVLVLLPDTRSKVLTPEEEKMALLAQYGDSALTIVKDQMTSFEAFAKTVLAPATIVVVGEENEYLQALQVCSLQYGFTLEITPTVLLAKQVVCAPVIAERLAEGNIKEVSAMLGRPYNLSGIVVVGKQLGRTVGMPTVNLQVPKNKHLPKLGVYATVLIVDGEHFLGVTNIGRRPTVDDFSYITIETFLLHFSRELYGQFVTLEVKAFIREIKMFDSLSEVRKQVDEDVRFVAEHGLL